MKIKHDDDTLIHNRVAKEPSQLIKDWAVVAGYGSNLKQKYTALLAVLLVSSSMKDKGIKCNRVTGQC